MDQRKIINGTNGKVVLEGDELTNATAFQAKVEFTVEEHNFLGDMATYNTVTGYKGTGSITLHKTDSRLIKKVGEVIRQGKTPVFTIIGETFNPNTGERENIALEQVVFTDLTLFDFEAKAPSKVEAPFNYAKWRVYSLYE